MENNLFVAMSGGIDSTALALLLPDAELIFTDTEWEFDELYEHLERFEHFSGRVITRLCSPKGGLPNIIEEQQFFPNFHTRFCTRESKILPMNFFLKKHLPATLCIGLRSDEPLRIGNLTSMDGLTIRYPLREAGMTRADCVALCDKYGLLPRYPIYMLRGGCKGCFFKSKKEIRALVTLRHDIADELQSLEESVQDQRKKFFHLFPNIGMSLADFRKQQELFTPEEVYSSIQLDAAPCGVLCHK
jgi:hypothetical protein